MVEGQLDGLAAHRLGLIGPDRVLTRATTAGIPGPDGEALWDWLETVMEIAAAELVIASGGTAGLGHAVTHARDLDIERVVVLADPDRGGLAAARAAGADRVARPWASPGTPADLADLLAEWQWLSASTRRERTFPR